MLNRYFNGSFIVIFDRPIDMNFERNFERYDLILVIKIVLHSWQNICKSWLKEIYLIAGRNADNIITWFLKFKEIIYVFNAIFSKHLKSYIRGKILIFHFFNKNISREHVSPYFQSKSKIQKILIFTGNFSKSLESELRGKIFIFHFFAKIFR